MFIEYHQYPFWSSRKGGSADKIPYAPRVTFSSVGCIRDLSNSLDTLAGLDSSTTSTWSRNLAPKPGHEWYLKSVEATRHAPGGRWAFPQLCTGRG